MRTPWVVGLGTALLAWALASIAVQSGPRALGLTVVSSAGVALFVAVVFGLLKVRLISVLPAAVLPIALWAGLLGSYSFTRDLLGAAVGMALAWPAARVLSRWREARSTVTTESRLARPRRRFVRRYILLCFVFVWVINSTLNVVFEARTEPRSRNPHRLAQADDAPWPNVRVGLALSGGGYRAAIMHAGVLAELDAMGVPITALSCVSGGSIIGSFYAVGGSPETFRDAVASGRMNLKRDMADVHNALRLPFPVKVPYLDVELFPWVRFGRVDVQANLVDRVLLGGTTLRDLQGDGRPSLQICTTDLRTGSAVGLAADGVTIRTPPRPARARSGGRLPYEVEREFHPGVPLEARVAELVAASGAFPGAFSAVDLTLPPSDGLAARRLLLADGGIVDNWGVGLLLDRARSAAPDTSWRLDALLISAGGRIFGGDEDVPAPEELRRAIDIVYETAGWRPVEEIGGGERPPIILLQPGDVDHDLPEYRAFADASTLTERYTAEQARLLFDLGRHLVRVAAADLVPLLDSARAGSNGLDRDGG